MDLFLKLTAGVLVTVVTCLILRKNGADTAMLLSTAVCCMVIIGAVSFFQPIIDFCSRLQQLGNLDCNILNILLKAVGIGLVAQLTGLICNDSGNQTLGKTLQLVGTAAILWLALPLLEELITLLDTVLGAI